ncbi:formate-dependent phosphoribosylglycinamide formyltransferase [Mycobacterium interjectum]|uniref:formate-dependent phosphoribosylglycinamide formyltransferase n=1 Tax=Mycobacterium interjectum TaxID=33895 RepID=UPI00083784A5
MTDGFSEGQDDRTTALVLPPQTPSHDPDGAPTVLLLGSGELSRELATALRHLGARVIAVEERLADADELAGAIQQHQPQFVVTATDAVAVEALSHDHEGTELVPSARTVRLTADREALRRLAADELGLPTAPFWFVGSVGELQSVAAHAGYPLLVKPVSGRGHSVVSGPDDIEPAWQRAVGNSAGRVMAETVVDVDFDVTLLAVRKEGPTGPVLEFCSPIGHRDADGAVLESWQPQQMSDAAVDAAKSIAARIIKALGGRGVFGVGLMIKGDEVYFSDVTAHPHPSVWVTLRSQRLSAFELHARAILGLPVDTMMMSPAAAHLIDAGHDGGSLTVDALGGALRVPESDLRIFAPQRRSAALGVALATAPDVAAARDRARQVANALTVRDSRG